MNKTGIIASNEKKSKKKLKLYNPQELEKDEQDVPYIATAFAEIIKYFIVYLLLLIFTFFSLIFFIINSILFYVLFFIMTLCEFFDKIKKKFSHKKKHKSDPSLRPIRRNSSNENFKKMRRMEKSQEYLGEKTLNLFMEIKNVLVLFVDKKIDSDVHEIVIHPQGKKQIHYYFKIRPFVQEFIENTYSHFNLIIYTSLDKELADKILDILEIDKLIEKKFYRDSCFENKFSKKDPSKDLSGIITHDSINRAMFLDYSANATLDIKHSTLLIKPWDGKKKDEDEGLKLCLDALHNFIEDPENKVHIIESFHS